MKIAQHIHSSVNGHLDCFHFGAITNRAAMDIPGRVFFAEHMYALLVGAYLKVELLAHTVCICSVSKLYFKELSKIHK